jgi:hypothetical protein
MIQQRVRYIKLEKCMLSMSNQLKFRSEKMNLPFKASIKEMTHTVWVFKLGLMALHNRAATNMARNTEKAYSIGRMEVNTKVIFAEMI